MLLLTAEFTVPDVENALGILPDDLSEEARTSLADALHDNPVLAGDPHMAHYLQGMLLAPVRPGVLEELCEDPSVPLPLRHRATWGLSESGSRGAEAVRLVCTQVVESASSSEDAVASAVSGIGDVGLAERLARDERLSGYTRMQAVERLAQLGRPSVAVDCADLLLADPEDQWLRSLLAHLLRLLGESTRCRQILSMPSTIRRSPSSTGSTTWPH